METFSRILPQAVRTILLNTALLTAAAAVIAYVVRRRQRSR